jgi:hypothetical protein
LRAEALGGGDVKIQQIAYEDSIKPLVADTRHRSVRWLAALMTPGLLPDALREIKATVPYLARRRSKNLRTPSRLLDLGTSTP